MFYQVENIPLFAPNIAYGDLISATEEDGELHFDGLIEACGHSTIQMIIFGDGDALEIGAIFERSGCTWEGSHLKNYIAIDVPKEINYSSIKSLLEEGRENGRWDYKEACLAHRA